MRIDRTHRIWFRITAVLLCVLTASYVVYAIYSPSGPKGSTSLGIFYGVLGYALMVYAALLGLRKKVPLWRIGRAQTWMRGHLWMGSLAVPVILFHCGFQVHGGLAAALMFLLAVVAGSGFAGAAIQHYLPSLMTRSVPLETIYEEIPHVREQLCADADQVFAALTVSAGSEALLTDDLSVLYQRSIRPMLGEDTKRAVPMNLEAVFDSLRSLVPDDSHEYIVTLENICEEERQLQRQRRLYFWLHAWLLIHVPTSIALLVLGAIHGVAALRY